MNRAVITVIGDVHNLWSTHDAKYLVAGEQDLVLFVGDLGDENVDIVRDVAGLAIPKAVLLGNHDAWRSFSNKQVTKTLRQSVELLGSDHLAYACRDLPEAEISIVGARPFSWGGADLRSPQVYDELFGIQTMEQSAEAICEAAVESAQFRDLIVLAHNGPRGLSSAPESIFGKDFGKRPGGDWGDLDLALALDMLGQAGFRVRAVIAGHMHHRLHPQVGGGYRTRFVRSAGTLFFNAAVVPRIRSASDGDEVRHYLVTSWANGEFESAEEVWVDKSGAVRERFSVRFHDLSATRSDR